MQVRYFAAAKAATGVEAEQLPAPETLGALLRLLGARHSASASDSAPALPDLLPNCSFLHNGVAVRRGETPLSDSDTVDVLPPFAGG